MRPFKNYLALMALLAVVAVHRGVVAAFCPVGLQHQRRHHQQQPQRRYQTQESSLVVLSMGGLNKARNKQADLKRKMEAAKQQKKGEDGAAVPTSDAEEKPLTDQEIKERNDRLRFEQLLQKEGSRVLNDFSSDGYLNRRQEEEEITAARSGADRLFEGDPAPTDCFEGLIDVTTGNILAKKGAPRLVPWLTAGPDEDDYRVIIADPRVQSTELHQAIKDLSAALPTDIQDRLYYINADTPADNRKWMKKNSLTGGKVQIYCDSQDKDWMKAYTALGDKRWSMTMFIIARGKVMNIAREMDIYNTSRTVMNAVKAMKKELSQ